MKLRNGFVSNSSSSSFIVLGVKLTEEEKEKLWSEDDYDYDLVKGLGYEHDSEGSGDVIVGLHARHYEEYGVFKGFGKADFDKAEALLRQQFGPDRELDLAVWYGMVYS